MGLGGLANPIAEGRIQTQGMAGGAVQLLCAAWMIGGQAQGRMLIAQTGFPVGQLPLALPLRQPLALPAGVIGVLRRQWRQQRLLALGGRRIQARELVDQHIQRPAVRNDVMHRHQQLMVFVVEAHQRHPQQRAFLQIEPGPRFILADLLRAGFTLGSRQIADVDHLQVELSTRSDLLQSHAITLEEARAQGFVALDQLLETGAQCILIQLTTQAQGTRNVVGAAVGVELPGDPQTVLCQRLRHRLLARQRRDRALGQATVLLLTGHGIGEGAEGRGFEQQAQVQLQPQRFTQTRHHLRRCNGVAAEQEEMIVGAHLRHLQLLTPDTCDQALQRRSRLAIARAFVAGRREHRVAVEAAVRQAIATRRALQFTAGRFGQRTRIEQHHHARCFLIRLGDGLANGFDQRLGRQDFLHAAADFGGDADALLTIDRDGKGGNAALAYHFHFALDGLFDVLRVQVVPAHDQHVLQTAGDEQLAVAHETQVTGSQPGLAGVPDERLG
ncbi:hypothetical protein D3C73_421520 [compost metagenome]